MGIVVASSMVIVIVVTPVGSEVCGGGGIYVRVISSKGKSKITGELSIICMMRPSKGHCSCINYQKNSYKEK